MSIGIYKITNRLNQKSYIGQSTNIERRWHEHQLRAFQENAKSYDYPLYRAIRKYVLENFIFEILEECPEENLNTQEIYWIDYYNTFFEGYNQTLGGDNSGHSSPKENIIGIINDLKFTELVHSEIAKKWNVSIEMVQGINTGRYWRHNILYPIRKKVERPKTYCQDCGIEISFNAIRCDQCNRLLLQNNSNKPIKEELLASLLEANGNFSAVGRKFNVSPTTIRRWCLGYDLSSSSDDYKKDNKIKIDNNSCKKIIVQCDKDTERPIATFSSPSDAARAIGKQTQASTHITAACMGKRKSAYGFKWKYKE